jgi:hypothetical protein
MKEMMVQYNPWISVIFYISAMVIGIFMVLNLFLAVLLNSLDMLDESDINSTTGSVHPHGQR